MHGKRFNAQCAVKDNTGCDRAFWDSVSRVCIKMLIIRWYMDF